MSRPAARPLARRPLSAAFSLTLTALVGLVALVATLLVPVEEQQAQAGELAPAAAAARKTTNPATPGDFTGYGFDQCLAPTQKAMDAWLHSSPFLAVGIYISGDARACRSQPNLTPTWVSTQLAKGWRLLPITLGPQASCQPRFPRYSDDVKINPKPGKNKSYKLANKMGVAEAGKAVAAAQALGIVAGSTLWYDLEGYDNTNTDCRESALSFLSGWTQRLHELGYVSGVYSSAGSGIKALDEARRTRPTRFVLPDRLWIARWDGKANTSVSSAYMAADGWRPGGRVKQYRGGHLETHGGVTINIDSNYLDLGAGSVARPEVRCGGVPVSFTAYPKLKPRTATYKPSRKLVKALQCLLQEQGAYAGKLSGKYNKATRAAVQGWRPRIGLSAGEVWNGKAWVSLLAAGAGPVLKVGSAGDDVRRLQRALNATKTKTKVPVDGVFRGKTTKALKEWQARAGLPATGVAAPNTWALLTRGKR